MTDPQPGKLLSGRPDRNPAQFSSWQRCIESLSRVAGHHQDHGTYFEQGKANSYFGVPFLELILGLILAVGFFARPGVVVVIGIMIVATYVHSVVDNPSLFPLQPKEPIIPLIVIVMSIFILWRGAGAWSMDWKAGRNAG